MNQQEKDRLCSARMRAKFPEKWRARSLLNTAIESKRIKRQPCERCGFKSNGFNKVHGHHEDYSKPYDVMWLCSGCHGARHRELRALAQRATP